MSFVLPIFTCNQSDPTVWNRVEIRVPTPNVDIIPMQLIDAELAILLSAVDPNYVSSLPYRESFTVKDGLPVRFAWFRPEHGEEHVIAICRDMPTFNPWQEVP